MMPGLNWKVIDVSLLFLGQLAYRLCLTLPSLLHTHLPCFQLLNSIELVVLNAQDSCYCAAGLFAQQ